MSVNATSRRATRPTLRASSSGARCARATGPCRRVPSARVLGACLTALAAVLVGGCKAADPTGPGAAGPTSHAVLPAPDMTSGTDVSPGTGSDPAQTDNQDVASTDTPLPAADPAGDVQGTVATGRYKCTAYTQGMYGGGGIAGAGYDLIIGSGNTYQSSLGTDRPGVMVFTDDTHFTFQGGFLDGDTGDYQPGQHIDYHTPDRRGLFGCYP